MMIEKNVGNVERVLRLILGVGFAIWVFTRPGMNAIEWFVAGVSVFLILNGIFSRCYLWYILDLNTRERKPGPTRPSEVWEC